jgi:hypothetical protein
MRPWSCVVRKQSYLFKFSLTQNELFVKHLMSIMLKYALPLLTILASHVDAYVAPNSTGIRIQHGFEQVLVQPL